jgi:hypothetical protein
MRDIYDIVKEEIFDNIDLNVKVITANTSSGGTQVVTLCNNKWIRVGQNLTDSGDNLWIITAIATNGDVTLTVPSGESDLVRDAILTIKHPQWLFGTHWSANNEYTLKGNDSRVKLPLIWLVENVEETEYGIRSSKERDSRVRIYFLDDNNPTQYLNADYRLNVVSPMIALKDEVIRVIKDNLLFGVLESWQTRPLTRFGNEEEKGYFENILDENLSGVELRITLPINKKKNCKC